MSRKGTSPETCLYRLYDEHGALLYVGVSGRWLTRIGEHAARKGWWGDVAMVKCQPFSTRAEALAAEATAIREEQPLHNVHGRKPRLPRKAPRTLAPLPTEVFELLAAIESAARAGDALPASDPDDLDTVIAHFNAAEAHYLQAAALRRRLVVLLHQSGWTPTEIGARLGISRARADQITKQDLP